MNADRLRHAVTVGHDVVANQKPYFHDWWVEEPSEAFNCHTAACFAGWLIRDPWVRAQGLVLDEEEHCPSYGGRRDFEALALFFAIPTEQAQWLFGMDYEQAPVTAEMVVARLELLLG